MYISRVNAGGERYYLSSVAGMADTGQSERVIAGGDQQGLWEGRAAFELGLRGAAQEAEIRRIMAGFHPVSGEPLCEKSSIKIRAWDLTFAAPKVVSLVWGLGSDQEAEQAEIAHRIAVRTALGYIEDNALGARRQAKGERQRVNVTGALGVSFSHALSRASQPHLHTHLVVANMVKSNDEYWTALDSRRLHAHAVAAGRIYHCHLRYELNRRFDRSFRAFKSGRCTVAGLPDELVRGFSLRRSEIEAQLSQWGSSGPSARRAAALATRQDKLPSWEPREMRERWRDQANAVTAVWSVPSQIPLREHLAYKEPSAGQAVEMAASRSGFFHRSDLVSAFADLATEGLSGPTLERLTAETLASPMVKFVSGREPAQQWWADPRTVRSARNLIGFSRTVKLAQGAHAETLDSCLLSRPDLGNGEVASARNIVTSSASISVLRTGGSVYEAVAVLEATRASWQAAGLKVIAIAPDVKAAAQLEAWTGIETVSNPDELSQCDVRIAFGAHSMSINALERCTQNLPPDSRLVIVAPHKAKDPLATLLERLPATARTLAVQSDATRFDGWVSRSAGPATSPIEHCRVDIGEHSVHMFPTAGLLLRRLSTKVASEVASDPQVELVGRDRISSVGMVSNQAIADLCNSNIRGILASRGDLGPTFRVGGVHFAQGDLVRAARPGSVNNLREIGTVIDSSAERVVLSVGQGSLSLGPEEVVRRRIHHVYVMTPGQLARAELPVIAEVGVLKAVGYSAIQVDADKIALLAKGTESYLTTGNELNLALSKICEVRSEGGIEPEDAVRKVLGFAAETSGYGGLLKSMGPPPPDKSGRALWRRQAGEVLIREGKGPSVIVLPRTWEAPSQEHHLVPRAPLSRSKSLRYATLQVDRKDDRGLVR